MNSRQLNRLLSKYLSGKASPEEKEKIENWYESVKEPDLSQDSPEFQQAGADMYRKIQAEFRKKAAIVPLYKRTWPRVAAAASVILLVAAWLHFSTTPTQTLVSSQPSKPSVNHDFAPPAACQAILMLSDGRVINVDSTGKGTIALQGHIRVEKKADGHLAYTGVSGSETGYNTLVVPRGSKPVSVVLSDGTRVWLNVASSITYPTAFHGKERSVTIDGEAYFEVASDPSMPFRVRKKKQDDVQIQVLGTHFNVNAYDDEPTMKVTLFEGAVVVGKGKRTQLLKPGQQAVVDASDLQASDSADLPEVMAWKDGRFYFDGTNIRSIMRQVEKWYNVDVSYAAPIPYSFVAKISRDVNVSELLHILEATNLVHFRMEGNKIIVLK